MCRRQPVSHQAVALDSRWPTQSQFLHGPLLGVSDVGSGSVLCRNRAVRSTTHTNRPTSYQSAASREYKSVRSIAAAATIPTRYEPTPISSNRMRYIPPAPSVFCRRRSKAVTQGVTFAPTHCSHRVISVRQNRPSGPIPILGGQSRINSTCPTIDPQNQRLAMMLWRVGEPNDRVRPAPPLADERHLPPLFDTPIIEPTPDAAPAHQ